MKRDFFYDEEVIAKKIYENGFRDGYYTFWQGKMLAKYFRWTLGYGDAKVETSLKKYCKEHDPNYVEVRQRKSVRRAAGGSRKAYVKKASPISITKAELDKIKAIKNFKAQKMLLGFLIYAKRDDGYINRENWSRAKRMVGLSVTRKEIIGFVRIFYNTGFMEIRGGAHFINFIDRSSDVVFTISDEKALYTVGNMYSEYCGGEELAWCKECGTEIVKNGKNHIFCDVCSKEKELERKRRWKNTKYKR